MSTTTIRARFKPGGILTDADQVVLSDPAAAYGVRRRDTNAVVVAANQAMTRIAAGTYSYSFTDPAPNLEYEFFVAFTYGAQTIHEQRSILGGRGGNLYDVLPLIIPVVNGAPEPFIKQILRLAAAEFCLDTHVWKEDLAPINSVEDQAEYALDHDYNASILRVRAVTLNDIRWQFALNPSMDAITINPSPNNDDDPIVVSVTFLPWESNDVYPDWIIQRHSRALAAATVARLAAMSGRPWFNPNVFNEAAREYRRLVGEAKMENQRGGAAGNMRIRSGGFF